MPRPSRFWRIVTDIGLVALVTVLVLSALAWVFVASDPCQGPEKYDPDVRVAMRCDVR